MDPITATVLATTLGPLVSGAAGEAGKHAWTALTDLVRRRFSPDSDEVRVVTALAAAPNDPGGVEATATLLARNAAQDQHFAAALGDWLGTARQIAVSRDNVSNVVSGTVHGDSILARDIGTLNLGHRP